MSNSIELPPWVDPPRWEVSPPDLTKFIGELSAFVRAGSVLCLEGGDAADVEHYLQARPGPIENKTNQGFLKMRPKVFFMPITPENLRGLGELTEVHAEPEVCDNLRVYDGEKISLSWHDLPSDPIYVASSVDEAALRKFCEALGCGYLFRASAG
jgi:hypothetical protein